MKRIHTCALLFVFTVVVAVAFAPAAQGADVFAPLTEKKYMESDDAFLEHLVALSRDEQQALVSEMINASLESLGSSASSLAGASTGGTATASAASDANTYIDPHSGRRFIYDETLKDWRVDESYAAAPAAPVYAQPQPVYQSQPVYQQQPQYHQSSGGGFQEAVQTMGAAASIINLFRR